jgi:inner membrane protein
MEPVTHLLTGACLARTGFNRRAAYATLTMAVAAEFPDIDTLWGLRGPVEGFTHHRGITHTFLGLPFEAAVLVGAVYGWHRWRLARARRSTGADVPHPARVAKPLTAAPVRWGLLYGFALLGLLSHLLLDYTNNYGIRPFFPFNDRWYAASIVFIFDPVIFGLLLLAIVVPWLLGLVSAEVGARKATFRGRGLAIAALSAVVGMWTLRVVEHGRAIDLAMAQNVADLPKAPLANQPPSPDDAESPPAANAPPVYLEAQRALASPDPINPFAWTTATDFGPFYQVAEVDLRAASLVPYETTYPKLPRTPEAMAAYRSGLGRAYLDWSPMPIVDSVNTDSELAADTQGNPNAAGFTVTFRDPRFMGGWLRATGNTALTGTVLVDRAGRVVRQSMDGRIER